MIESDHRQRLDVARYRLAAADVIVKLMRLSIALKRFDPSQPRVPAGSRDGGRWVEVDESSNIGSASGRAQRSAQAYSMGELVAEIPRPVGRDCVYRFDFGLVMVPGPTNLRCVQTVPSAAVRHGVLLNDN